MDLPSQLTSLEEIDEKYREAYREEDGVFVLGVADLDKHPHIARLDATNKAVRKERDQAQRELKAARALGNPEEIAAKLARLDELEAKAGAGDPAGDAVKKARAVWQTEAEADRKKLEAERDEANQKYRKVAKGDRQRSLIIGAGANPDYLDEIARLTDDNLDLDAGGQLVVVDSDGTPSSLTPEKFYERYREKKPLLFLPRSGSGTGTPKGASSGDRGATTVQAGDDKSFLANLDGIAKGDVTVKWP